jgi:hypothetical protein
MSDFDLSFAITEIGDALRTIINKLKNDTKLTIADMDHLVFLNRTYNLNQTVEVVE